MRQKLVNTVLNRLRVLILRHWAREHMLKNDSLRQRILLSYSIALSKPCIVDRRVSQCLKGCHPREDEYGRRNRESGKILMMRLMIN